MSSLRVVVAVYLSVRPLSTFFHTRWSGWCWDDRPWELYLKVPPNPSNSDPLCVRSRNFQTGDGEVTLGKYKVNLGIILHLLEPQKWWHGFSNCCMHWLRFFLSFPPWKSASYGNNHFQKTLQPPPLMAPYLCYAISLPLGLLFISWVSESICRQGKFIMQNAPVQWLWTPLRASCWFHRSFLLCDPTHKCYLHHSHRNC